jgi:hypothetical protein
MPLARSLAFVCWLFAGVASAATFSVPLRFEPVTSGSDHWLAAPFDLGLEFAEIESVTVAIELPDGFDQVGYCTGNSCASSDLFIEVVALGRTSDPFLPGDQEVYFSPHAWQVDNGTWQRRIGPNENSFSVVPVHPNEALGDLDKSLLVPPLSIPFVWPEGLLQGRGVAAFAEVITGSSWSRPPSRQLRLPTRSTLVSPTHVETTLSPVTGTTLTVTGTLVPEPSSAAMTLLAMIGLGRARSRR